MQKQDQTRQFSPQSVFNQGYVSADSGSPTGGSQSGEDPTPNSNTKGGVVVVGGGGGGVTSRASGSPTGGGRSSPSLAAGKHQIPVQHVRTSGMYVNQDNRGQSQGGGMGSPTKQIILTSGGGGGSGANSPVITNRPHPHPHTHAGPNQTQVFHMNNIGPQTQLHIGLSRHGIQIQPKSGSNFSSPASSVSFDSKGSSPRTSLINPPPPVPLDQRLGSPHGSMASLRSSISATSQDSKHSSPRTSLAYQLYDKFPSPRGSVASSASGYDPHQPLSDGKIMYTFDGTRMTPQTNMRMGALNDVRYNEPAPPPPYEAKHRPINIHVNVQGGRSPQHSPSPQGTTVLRASRSPLTVSTSDIQRLYTQGGVESPMSSYGQSQQMATQSYSPRSGNVSSPSPSQMTNSYSSRNAIPSSALQNAVRVPVQHQLSNRAQSNNSPVNKSRLHYDVVPPRPLGPSEAEKKLTALTEQLEKEMRLGSLSRGSPSMELHKAPPPYHGPHITQPAPASYSPNSVFSVASQSSTMSTPDLTPLSSVNSSVTNLKTTSTSLPIQVTPPPARGPSEAEKKLEALTNQLENEMENNPQGEYFGKFYFLQGFNSHRGYRERRAPLNSSVAPSNFYREPYDVLFSFFDFT